MPVNRGIAGKVVGYEPVRPSPKFFSSEVETLGSRGAPTISAARIARSAASSSENSCSADFCLSETWVRYVGVELATQLHETGVETLEEFFDLPAAPDYAQ